jgi:hypothetical protein
MKISTELSHDAEYIGYIQENRVGIDKSNLDFITTLLTSNLYSKPLESFLRETVANAYDSHMESGTDEHILLLIEDSGYKTYTISIRDYGVGVSPERFEKIYRNIGSSTKRDSNDYIGMFGIGRFSCLSCADVANITSYYNGKKYSYLMYKNGGGINIDKISETEGDFKNGLEVSIKKDVYQDSNWIDAIYHLCLFDKLHITYQGESYFLKDLTHKFNARKITNFNTFSRCSLLSTHKNYFRVGNVLYEIGHRIIDLATTDGLIINLPIGSVDITPNREALQYTDYTNRTISQKVAETRKELQDMVNTHIKGDISMSEFFNQFCDGGTYTINVDEENFAIDKEDVEIDSSTITIGGEPVPEGYDKFLDDVRYIGIEKSLIHKGINKSGYSRSIDTSIRHLILGDYVLVDKLDKVTKRVTWLYFASHVTHTSVVLVYKGLESFKAQVERYANSSAYADKDTVKEYVDFLFKNIKIGIMSNDAVPSSYIETYRQGQKDKRKKVDATKIPIRKYHSGGYRQTYLDDIAKEGLIVYSSHTQDDQTLKELANSVCFCNGIGGIITLKAEYLPLLANNRRFITVESFLFLRNKVLSKLVTATIIYDKFNKTFDGIFSFHDSPIWREFLNKYISEKKCIDYGNLRSGTFRNIVDYYTKKGWVNQYDIQYFSLSKEEIQAVVAWDKMKESKRNIIQMLAFQKFGRMPKIGLVPVKIPKLTYIEEKTNESI